MRARGGRATTAASLSALRPGPCEVTAVACRTARIDLLAGTVERIGAPVNNGPRLIYRHRPRSHPTMTNHAFKLSSHAPAVPFKAVHRGR